MLDQCRAHDLTAVYRLLGIERQLQLTGGSSVQSLQNLQDDLDTCLRCFPAGQRVAVEPRHESWWVPEVREVLERNGAALCWADRGSQLMAPLWRTADWGYVRLHQGRAAGHHYGRRALDRWVERIGGVWPGSTDVHVYFDNDVGGAAVRDAVAFARAARHVGLQVSRTPVARMLERPEPRPL